MKRLDRRGGAARFPRVREFLGGVILSGVVAMGLTGCKTVETEARHGKSSMMPTLDGSPENPFATKTDFTREMSAEQKFNVHVELGKVYESQQNFEAALAEYSKAVELADKKGGLLGGTALGPEKKALVQRRLGGANDRMGRFTQAESHYRKALEYAPGDAKVWNDVGYSYYLQNRFDDARNSLMTAESLDANNPKILTNLGLALAAAGKSDEALKALSRAGGPAIGHANLGFILAALGETAEARSHYQAALELQPQLTAARDAIAKLDAPPVLAEPATAIAAAPSPVAPAPTLPPMMTDVNATLAKPEAKSDTLTRTAAPRRPSPPVKPITPSASRPRKANEDLLANLPELPPTMTADKHLKAASATLEVPAQKPTASQPRRDPALHKATATPVEAGTTSTPRRDEAVKPASAPASASASANPTLKTRIVSNPIPAAPW